MLQSKTYLHILICLINILNLTLNLKSNEKPSLKRYPKYTKSVNFTKAPTNSINIPHNFTSKNTVDNYYGLRELSDSTSSITITINGPKENVKIINDGFIPKHVYINNNPEDFGGNNTIDLTQEGPNTITMVWDTQIKKALNMFSGCSSIISIDFSNFDASGISTMKEMFLSCTSLEYVNLTNFVTKGCKNMESMFNGCSSLKTLDLSSFNTTQVTNMDMMFSGCSSLTSLDLSNFKTPSLKNMVKMVSDCISLTSLEMPNFDTKSVKTMNGVFTNCSKLIYLNLSSFDTSMVSIMSAMFKDCSSLQQIYIPNIDTSSVNNMNNMFCGCNSLLNIDFINKFDTSLVTNMNSMFKDCSSLQSLELSSFNTDTLGNMEYMFFGCKSLKSLNLSNFYTYSLKTMNHLFNGCQSLISLDISHFNTTLVKSMNYLFHDCFKIQSINLESFNTASVTSMTGMFYSCSSLESLDLSNFQTSLVKTMNDMFLNCVKLGFINLTNFDMTSITNMKNMFLNCSSLKNIDLTNSIGLNLELIFSNLSSINIINRTNNLDENIDQISTDTKNSIENIEQIPNEIKNSTENVVKTIINTTMVNLATQTEKIYIEQIVEKKYSTQLIDKYSENYQVMEFTNVKTNSEIKDIKDLSFTQLMNEIEKMIEIDKYNNTHINEIISNLDELLLDKDPSKVYKITGIDYQIYITPINSFIEDASVNIHLEECEKKLKEKFPSKNFTILQMNLKNNNTNCLVDQVEYKIYDENKEPVDLSLCKDVNIKIEYKIQNSSLVNMEQIKDFKNQGIDVFNIKDTFFNDICYPYTDGDSNSDMILTDRVSDIYQNFSICGDNCEYDSFNVEKNVANCNCKIKTEVDTEIKEGNFESSIESAFLDSNFGVIKCFNLVFGIKGKLNNYGFWILGILAIFHIPTYIMLFINGINPVKNYIKKEMNNKGYLINPNDFGKEKEFRPKLESNKNMLTIIKDTIDIDEMNNSAPPKKNKITRRLSKKNKIHLEKIKEDPDKFSKNSFEDENEYQNKVRKGLKEVIGTEKVPDKRKSTKTVNFRFKHFSKTNLETMEDEPKVKKIRRIKKNSVSHINNIINTYDRMIEKDKTEKENKEVNHDDNGNNIDEKKDREFPLILVNANNNEKNEILKSNHKLNIYNYDEALLYEKRSYFRIFFIYLISKDNLLNLIFFNPPLELKPLRICLFIFNYACDLALNALFYMSENISDKYHYTGPNRLFFSLINNMTKTIVSTIFGYILLFIFQSLSQSSDTIVKLFRTQDDLLKKDKTYKVDDETKRKISFDLNKILKCLKIKIICCVIFELILTLFFFYYVTAFCHVYKNTQVSWLLDSLSSYIISFCITLVLSLILASLYKISIKYKINMLYKISLLIY